MLTKFEGMSASRISELTDYATAYGEIHESLPNGTHMTFYGPTEMTDERREAIKAGKAALLAMGVDYDAVIAELYGED